MNLHEYQAKYLLKNFGVAVPVGYVAETPEAAVMLLFKYRTKQEAKFGL